MLSDIVRYEIGLLQNSVLFAKSHVLHPEILNYKKFERTINSIKLSYGKMWISADTSVLLSHVKIETFTRIGIFIFLIKLPVVETTLHSLYNVFPLPTLVSNNTYFFLEPSFPLFLYGYLTATHR